MDDERIKYETYIAEMKSMIDKAIKRMKNEKPKYVIFTVSIWTDKDACVSAISFDSIENSLCCIKKANEWRKKHSLELITKNRFTNPADFELSDFEEINHIVIPSKWYSALVKIGKYAFDEINTKLNVDKQNFELGINSTKDWYAKTWNINSLHN